MKNMNNFSKIIIGLGVIIVLILGAILHNSYSTSTSNDKYYKECIENAKEYVKEENWDMVLSEMDKLKNITPKDKKLIEQRDLFITSAKIHKNQN